MAELPSTKAEAVTAEGSVDRNKIPEGIYSFVNAATGTYITVVEPSEPDAKRSLVAQPLRLDDDHLPIPSQQVSWPAISLSDVSSLSCVLTNPHARNCSSS